MDTDHWIVYRYAMVDSDAVMVRSWVFDNEAEANAKANAIRQDGFIARAYRVRDLGMEKGNGGSANQRHRRGSATRSR